jgi:hypothetical protein
MPAGLTQRRSNIIETIKKMELLWRDLADANEKYPSPAWHRDELARTEEGVRTGKVKFASWNKAKVDIRKRIE